MINKVDYIECTKLQLLNKIKEIYRDTSFSNPIISIVKDGENFLILYKIS